VSFAIRMGKEILSLDPPLSSGSWESLESSQNPVKSTFHEQCRTIRSGLRIARAMTRKSCLVQPEQDG
jgi:hypothetical protein